MLSILVQKNQIMVRSCQQYPSFSVVIVVIIFLTRSLLLLFPTYTISKGMRAACATVFAVVVNFLIHSMSSPPYKKMYLSSLICVLKKEFFYKKKAFQKLADYFRMA